MTLGTFILQHRNLERTNQGSCCLQCWWRTASHLGKTREQESSMKGTCFCHMLEAQIVQWHISSAWPWKLPHNWQRKILCTRNHDSQGESLPFSISSSGFWGNLTLNRHPITIQPVFGCPLFAMESVPGALLSWEQCSSCGASTSQSGWGSHLPSSIPARSEWVAPGYPWGVLNVATLNPSFSGATLQILEAPAGGKSWGFAFDWAFSIWLFNIAMEKSL